MVSWGPVHLPSDQGRDECVQVGAFGVHLRLREGGGLQPHPRSLGEVRNRPPPPLWSTLYLHPSGRGGNAWPVGGTRGAGAWAPHLT
eukprot:SAG11_NODE_456_length_9319_cov_5.131128_4_plen_87_part_00